MVLGRLGPVRVRLDHHTGCQVFEDFDRSLLDRDIAQAVVVFGHHSRKILVVHLAPSSADIQCRVPENTT